MSINHLEIWKTVCWFWFSMGFSDPNSPHPLLISNPLDNTTLRTSGATYTWSWPTLMRNSEEMKSKWMFLRINLRLKVGKNSNFNKKKLKILINWNNVKKKNSKFMKEMENLFDIFSSFSLLNQEIIRITQNPALWCRFIITRKYWRKIRVKFLTVEIYLWNSLEY